MHARAGASSPQAKHWLSIPAAAQPPEQAAGVGGAPQVPSIVTANGALHAMQRVLSSGWQTAVALYHLARKLRRAHTPLSAQRRARLQASSWP